MCRLFESILSTRSGDFTKCTKLHFVDEKLRTWTSCPGSWSQFCMVPLWASIHKLGNKQGTEEHGEGFCGHPLSFCFQSLVLSISLGGISMRWPNFCTAAWNAIHMPRYFEHWCLQDLKSIKFRNTLKWLAHRGYSGGWSRKHVICTRSRRRWRGWAASHLMSSIIFHYVASIADSFCNWVQQN